MRAVVVVVAGMLVVGSCGAGAVTESSEYVSLQTENESLSGDLEDTRVELGVSERRLEELDAQLSESETQLSDAEQQDLVIRADFTEFLTYQFSNAGGLSESQADCLSAELVGDDEARAAYFVLLTSTDTGSSQVTEAYDSLGGLFEGCDLDLPPLDGESSAATPGELPQEVVDATRPVEVIGASLPTLATTDMNADPARGTAAPILVGEDYLGQPVRIDGALDGPTMVVVVAHWCPHCNSEIPVLNELRDQDRIPGGVNVIAISSAINPDAPNFPPDEWIVDMDWTYPVMADGVDLERGVFYGSEAFGVSGVPFTTLIDGDGNVAARWAGARDPGEIVALLEALATTS